ncbi:MAG: type II secretion system F family protein [Lachnospiraceae bacterium]
MRRIGNCLLIPCALCLATAWLFFDFAPVSLLLLAYIPYEAAKRWRAEKEAGRWQLTLAFRDMLLYLQNALAAGYSPETSMKEAVRGLERLYGERHVIVSECRLVISRMENGYSMERALEEFGERSGVDEIRQFAEVFSVAKRTGGEIGRIIRQTGSVLQDKLELKRELHTAVAAKEMEFRIMCLVPHGILLYLKLCAPSMSAPLYHNTFGIVFMGVVFAGWLGLSALGNYLIHSGIRI